MTKTTDKTKSNWSYKKSALGYAVYCGDTKVRSGLDETMAMAHVKKAEAIEYASR